jgi:hypothetical protein
MSFQTPQDHGDQISNRQQTEIFAQIVEAGQLTDNKLGESTRPVLQRLDYKIIPGDGVLIDKIETKTSIGLIQIYVGEIKHGDSTDFGLGISLPYKIETKKTAMIICYLDDFEKLPGLHQADKDELRRMFVAGKIHRTERGMQRLISLTRGRTSTHEIVGDLQGALIGFTNWVIRTVFTQLCSVGALPTKINNAGKGQKGFSPVTPLEMIPDAGAIVKMLAEYFHDNEAHYEERRDLLVQARIQSRKQVQNVLDRYYPLPSDRSGTPLKDWILQAIQASYQLPDNALIPTPRSLELAIRVLEYSRTVSDTEARDKAKSPFSFRTTHNTLAKYAGAIAKFEFGSSRPTLPADIKINNELGFIDDEGYTFILSLLAQGIDTYSEQIIKLAAQGKFVDTTVLSPSATDFLLELIALAKRGNPVRHHSNSDEIESDFVKIYNYLKGLGEREKRRVDMSRGSGPLTLPSVHTMEMRAVGDMQANWATNRVKIIEEFSRKLKSSLPISHGGTANSIIEALRKWDPNEVLDLGDELIELLAEIITSKGEAEQDEDLRKIRFVKDGVFETALFKSMHGFFNSGRQFVIKLGMEAVFQHLKEYNRESKQFAAMLKSALQREPKIAEKIIEITNKEGSENRYTLNYNMVNLLTIIVIQDPISEKNIFTESGIPLEELVSIKELLMTGNRMEIGLAFCENIIKKYETLTKKG